MSGLSDLGLNGICIYWFCKIDSSVIGCFEFRKLNLGSEGSFPMSISN